MATGGVEKQKAARAGAGRKRIAIGGKRNSSPIVDVTSGTSRSFDRSDTPFWLSGNAR